MATSFLDLRVTKGRKFVQPIQVLTAGEVAPLTPGTTAKMQVRATKQSTVVLAELTSANGRLVVDVNAAKVSIIFPSAFSASLNFERGYYDCVLLYPDTEQETVAEGKVYLMPSVTQ